MWEWVTRVKREDYSRATFFHDSGFNVTATTSGINPNMLLDGVMACTIDRGETLQQPWQSIKNGSENIGSGVGVLEWITREEKNTLQDSLKDPTNIIFHQSIWETWWVY